MEIIFLIIGAVLGVCFDNLWKFLRDRYIVRKSEKLSEKLLNYDYLYDNIVMLNRWSIQHPLKRKNLRLDTADTFFEGDNYLSNLVLPEKIQSYISKEKERGTSGEICYLSGYTVDHKESEQGQLFFVKTKPIKYSIYLAYFKYINSDYGKELKHYLKKSIINSPQEYFKNAFPSNITVNAILLSENCNKTLAMQRSSSVETERGLWCIGATETMKFIKSNAGYQEDFYTLTQRALKEEVNLDPDDFGTIHISDFTIETVSFRCGITAIVRLNNMSENEVIRRANNSESNFETQKFEWLDLNVKEVINFIENKNSIYNDKDWIYFAKHSLSEALRIGTELKATPNKV
jgi:hypothetical protein